MMKKTLSEQFAKLLEHKPASDYIHSRLQAVEQSVSGALSMMTRMFDLFRKENRAQHERLKELEAAVETLTAELQAVSAANGKTQTDIVSINERVENMAEWAKTQGKR